MCIKTKVPVLAFKIDLLEKKMEQNGFEGIINNLLKDGIKKNAIDFFAYLKENEMIAGGNHGEVSYKDRCVCYMHLDGIEQQPGPWTIWTDGDYSKEYNDVPIDKHIKEIAWAHINYCANCGGKCSPGKQKTIFGKEFDNVCSADMAFYIPNTEDLECVKKLLEMRKYDILNNS